MATAVARLPSIESVLAPDRQLIEAELRLVLPRCHTAVSACMEYAVLGAGQRLRPLLALRASRLLRGDARLTLRAAAAIELLHCASLIVDDLPCMDDDVTRRNRPSAHVAYGEATAVLAAFGLVALAARTVIEQESDQAAGQRRFQIALLRTLDCSSLIGGQVMDLELAGDQREQCRPALNEMKTVPLFALAITAATSFAGVESMPELERFGRHFGMALQMSDDYLDGEIAEFGPLAQQFAVTEGCLSSYGASARPLLELVDYLHGRAQDHRHR